VNWARRFDHMQQHTGQHVLSAAFDRLHRARTVGFHLGAALSTVDLDKVLDASALASAESEANRIVWEDRPVSIRAGGGAPAFSFGRRWITNSARSNNAVPTRTILKNVTLGGFLPKRLSFANL
jgi:Ser-tRNA(Ala) deacylase AlaX